VTASVFGLLFVASYAIGEFLPPSRKVNVASFLLLLAAGIALWMRIELPVSRTTGDVLLGTTAFAWAVFIACVTPKWVREIKAAARD